jgi:hypothetical protein
MYFEFSQCIVYSGCTFGAGGWGKAQIKFTSLSNNSWLKGKSKKVELLVVNHKRWLFLLISATVHNLGFALVHFEVTGYIGSN